MILDEERSGKSTRPELRRKRGGSAATMAIWRRKYAGVERENLARYRELERENGQLKKQVAARCFARQVDASW